MSDEPGRMAFSAVCAAFERAWDARPTSVFHGAFAGEPLHLRVAGERLARDLESPFAHLRSAHAGGGEALRIDLWDVAETGVEGAAVNDDLATTWRLEDATFAASADGAVVRHATRAMDAWLDRRAARLTGWIADARLLSLHERARPLQVLLALWASDRGVHAVHGALVARGARGLLLAGDSGCGKSTAALCCLEAGFTFLGDDWVGIRPGADGRLVGHSLYSSVSLEPMQLARFPALRCRAVPARGAEPKSILLLSEGVAERIGRSASLRALALPRLAQARDSRVRPASKRDALLTLARSSIFTMRPRGGRAAMEALVRLVRDVPAYWLDLGDDLEQIPLRVEEILTGLGA